MSVATALPTITSIDDAISEIYRLAEGGALNLHDATCEVFPLLRLSAEQRDMLALEGLYQRAMHAKRRAVNLQARPVSWGAPHGRQWEPYMRSLGHTYRAADGSQRMLLEFTIDDLAAFATSMRVTADGYARRAAWASETQAVLVAAGKARVCDLPADKLAEVAQAASEAFGRQE